MTRDRKGQTFVPGFLTAVYFTPVQTEGNLPGGGGLFEACTRAVVEVQLPLGVEVAPGICPRCGGALHAVALAQDVYGCGACRETWHWPGGVMAVTDTDESEERS